MYVRTEKNNWNMSCVTNASYNLFNIVSALAHFVKQTLSRYFSGHWGINPPQTPPLSCQAPPPPPTQKGGGGVPTMSTRRFSGPFLKSCQELHRITIKFYLTMRSSLAASLMLSRKEGNLLIINSANRKL